MGYPAGEGEGNEEADRSSLVTDALRTTMPERINAIKGSYRRGLDGLELWVPAGAAQWIRYCRCTAFATQVDSDEY